MKKLFLMCGFPFAGKSTIAMRIERETNALCISMDDINHERGLGLKDDEVIPSEEWEQTHQVVEDKIRELSKSGKDIILDDTNYASELRSRFRNVAKKVGYETYVVFIDVPAEVVKRRRSDNLIDRNRKHVPSAPFLEVLDNLETPTESENAIIYNHGDDLEKWIRHHNIR